MGASADARGPRALTTDLEPGRWYNPHVTAVRYAPKPTDLSFTRQVSEWLTDTAVAKERPVARATRLPDSSPWLIAYASAYVFDADARSLLDKLAWPGELAWLPMVMQTDEEVVEGYSVIGPGPERPDLMSEAHTTRDPRHVPIRWVLDRAKLGERQVAIAPGVKMGGLVMRGHVLQSLLDMGAVGVTAERARVVG